MTKRRDGRTEEKDVKGGVRPGNRRWRKRRESKDGEKNKREEKKKERRGKKKMAGKESKKQVPQMWQNQPL